MTDRLDVLNRLELTWGLQTLIIDGYKSLHDILSQLDKVMVSYGLARPGDRIVLTLGQPIDTGSKTNALYIHILGETSTEKLHDQLIPLRYR